MTDHDDQAAGGPAGLDLGALVQQAQALQQQMVEAQERQAAQIITGSAGGGKVTVEMTGSGEFRNVSIAKEAVDSSEIELLEDLVLAALRDAGGQIAETSQDAMGGVELPDLGALGGGLGGLLSGE